jgi:hypothetical protein
VERVKQVAIQFGEHRQAGRVEVGLRISHQRQWSSTKHVRFRGTYYIFETGRWQLLADWQSHQCLAVWGIADCTCSMRVLRSVTPERAYAAQSAVIGIK